jgi:hypothetical protein
MEIRTFYLPQLHNGEHVSFHSETIEHLKHTDPAILGISEQFETYSSALDRQNRIIDIFTASKLSPESAKLDLRRDRAYSALRAYLKVYANDTDSALSEAAERLLFVIRKSATDVGDPLHLGLAKETSAINSLLRNLESLNEDIGLIGAAGRLNELKTANRLFEKFQIERNVEKASKGLGNVKEARSETDAAYISVVKRINALALLHGNEMLESCIKEQNTVIEKYANTVARRKGLIKKDEGTETAQ